MIRDPRTAAVVAIGDELLAGDLVDTNSGEISRRLAEQGIRVERFLVLPDQRAALTHAFFELCSAYRLVVACGGLGPTLDDVTREAAAQAAGVALIEDQDELEQLRERWRVRGREMPASNVRQVQFPAGAQVMPNARGTAPGFRLWIAGGVLAVLPGPPVEMRGMLETQLLPWLLATTGRGEGLATQRVYLAGIPESAFADRVSEWMQRGANPLMGVTAKLGVLTVSVRASAATQAAAQELAAARAMEVRQRFAREQFDAPDGCLAAHVLERLAARQWTLATAESVTGGRLAGRLTDVAGASAVFREGWVTYSNQAKIQRLDVSASDLDQHGAVSETVACAMARGAARKSGADCALATTGVAGPGLLDRGVPVGTCWVACCLGGQVRAAQIHLAAYDRESLRAYTTNAALNLLREELNRLETAAR